MPPEKSAVVWAPPKPVGTSVTLPLVDRSSNVPLNVARPLSQPSNGNSIPSQGSRRSRVTGLAVISRDCIEMTSPKRTRPSATTVLASNSTSSAWKSTMIPSAASISAPPRNCPSGMRGSIHARSRRSPHPSVSSSVRNVHASPGLLGPRTRSPRTSVPPNSLNAASAMRIPCAPNVRLPNASRTTSGSARMKISDENDASRASKETALRGMSTASSRSRSRWSNVSSRYVLPSGPTTRGGRAPASAGMRILTLPSRIPIRPSPNGSSASPPEGSAGDLVRMRAMLMASSPSYREISRSRPQNVVDRIGAPPKKGDRMEYRMTIESARMKGRPFSASNRMPVTVAPVRSVPLRIPSTVSSPASSPLILPKAALSASSWPTPV